MDLIKSARPIEYKFIQKLGEGSFSTVYKALRKDAEFQIEQIIALKILKSKISFEKWRDEFFSLQKVRSPHCVKVLGWDYVNGHPALLLDWVEGVTLQMLLNHIINRPALDKAQIRLFIEELFWQINEGLKSIHQANICHGDLSPQNIMINNRGEVVLLDFGLSNTKEVHFTAEFAAPEVLTDGRSTAESDLYSLGRVREVLEKQLGERISDTTNRLLSAQPQERKSLQEEKLSYKKSRQARQLLSEIVQSIDLLPRMTSTVAFKKVDQGLKNVKFRLIVPMLAFLFLGPSSATQTPQMGHLMVRTKNWVRIQINGKDFGYTPIQIELPANKSLLLNWQSRNKSGQRPLTLRPGQNMVLTDSFFTPETP